jgi:hypothetical protein
MDSKNGQTRTLALLEASPRQDETRVLGMGHGRERATEKDKIGQQPDGRAAATTTTIATTTTTTTTTNTAENYVSDTGG